MRIAQLGTGKPELAIIGAVHGDEPCGVAAIDHLLESTPVVDRPVRLIVANEAALEAGVRFIDADLNRSFDYVTPAAHEAPLAEKLRQAIKGMTVLSIHSTRSTADPFAIVSGLDEGVGAIVSRLSVEAVVDAGPPSEGRIFDTTSTVIEVEAGRQGSEDAARNAIRIAEEFLQATGALKGGREPIGHPLFELGEAIQKPPANRYAVHAKNFTRVEEGDVFASADGEGILADRTFWPILLSAGGYQDIFGYRGEKLGTVRQVSDPPGRARPE
ncbi:MAG: succinylglutamate desuccinylase [Halodesulfurarchaeum sp.]